MGGAKTDKFSMRLRKTKGRAARIMKPVGIRTWQSKDAKKHYRSYNDERKLDINKIFAKHVVQHIGVGSKTIVLDTEKAITVRTMEKAGLSRSNITAPNINQDICRVLTRMGIRAPFSTIEKYIENCKSVYDAAFLDSMTTLSGSVENNHYVGVFVQHFLKKNRGKKCVLAVNIANRSKAGNMHGLNQKEMLEQQMRSLIAAFGFTVEYEEVKIYKKGMCFGLWNLVWAPDSVQLEPLLTWEGSKRLLGFPPNFTAATLAKFLKN